MGEAIAGAVADAGIADPPFPLCDLGVYCLAGIDLPVDEERLAPAIALRGWTGTDLLRNDTFAVSRAGHVLGLGHRRRVRHRAELCRCRARRNVGPLPRPGRTLRGLRTRWRMAGRPCPGVGPARRRTDEADRHCCARACPGHFDLPDAEAVLSAVYTGDLPYGRLFELASVLLDAASEGDAPARQAADLLADEVVAFVVAAATRLGVTDQAVEVVLGGGIFKTDDADFHARVAEGIHAVAPRAVLRHLTAPPVLGAALLGLDVLGADDGAKDRLRSALIRTAEDRRFPDPPIPFREFVT